MRRQVWSVDEIRDILMAAHEAGGMSAAAVDAKGEDAVRAMRAYRQGFQTALVSVAIALGLSPLATTFASDGPVP